LPQKPVRFEHSKNPKSFICHRWLSSFPRKNIFFPISPLFPPCRIGVPFAFRCRLHLPPLSCDNYGRLPSAGVSRKKCGGQNGRCQAPETVNRSRAVILSEAKDLGSCFWCRYLRRTAEMLRCAQHDRVEFVHAFGGFPQVRAAEPLEEKRGLLIWTGLTAHHAMRAALLQRNLRMVSEASRISVVRPLYGQVRVTGTGGL